MPLNTNWGCAGAMHGAEHWYQDGTAVMSVAINTAAKQAAASPDVFNARLRMGDQGWGTKVSKPRTRATLHECR